MWEVLDWTVVQSCPAVGQWGGNVGLLFPSRLAQLGFSCCGKLREQRVYRFSQTLSSLSVMEEGQGGSQGRNLEVEADAEAMEAGCLLASLVCFLSAHLPLSLSPSLPPSFPLLLFLPSFFSSFPLVF